LQFELILSQKIDAYFLKELMNVRHCKKAKTLNNNNKLNAASGFLSLVTVLYCIIIVLSLMPHLTRCYYLVFARCVDEKCHQS
jgi:hypothetical protein